jgi:demethylmenaquinone methyltransferase/2-methoxy-6-polyprenyl-1,4-benzoquinol methylase
MQESGRSYEVVAWCYDAIAGLYSLDAIRRARAWQLGHMRPGERALYIGIGSGEDALLAAEHGLEVTGLDLSPAMLRRARGRFERHGRDVALIQGDLFEYIAVERYDVVVANFFLNVFAPDAMLRALTRVASLVRPGGLLALADFAPPGPGVLRRGLSAAYYRPINLAGHCLGLCSLHPIYDYTSHFDALGIELVARQSFGLGRRGPAFYESIAARCRADH